MKIIKNFKFIEAIRIFQLKLDKLLRKACDHIKSAHAHVESECMVKGGMNTSLALSKFVLRHELNYKARRGFQRNVKFIKQAAASMRYLQSYSNILSFQIVY